MTPSDLVIIWLLQTEAKLFTSLYEKNETKATIKMANTIQIISHFNGNTIGFDCFYDFE